MPPWRQSLLLVNKFFLLVYLSFYERNVPCSLWFLQKKDWIWKLLCTYYWLRYFAILCFFLSLSTFLTVWCIIHVGIPSLTLFCVSFYNSRYWLSVTIRKLNVSAVSIRIYNILFSRLVFSCSWRKMGWCLRWWRWMWYRNVLLKQCVLMLRRQISQSDDWQLR